MAAYFIYFDNILTLEGTVDNSLKIQLQNKNNIEYGLTKHNNQTIKWEEFLRKKTGTFKIEHSYFVPGLKQNTIRNECVQKKESQRKFYIPDKPKR